jgi:hypothetical protein
MRKAATAGIDPAAATRTLAAYGELNMRLALRGLEAKTTNPYLAGWKSRVIPTLGYLPLRMITNGVVGRAIHGWISDECGKSTVKKSLAVLARPGNQRRRPSHSLGRRCYLRRLHGRPHRRSLRPPIATGWFLILLVTWTLRMVAAGRCL